MITLKSEAPLGATVLSNLFIDHYMPEANGEFVKVYIYLVRTLSQAPVSFTLEQMADHLLCTEKDILRALKYWTKAGLISLTQNDRKEIEGISLLALPSPAAPVDPEPTHTLHTEKAVPAEPTPITSAAPEASAPSAPADVQSTIISLNQTTRTGSLSRARVKELKQNEEVTQLLYVAELYLGKPLTSTETEKLLYFYDELKMSSDLIEYLIEYSVGKNKRSFRYMEVTALAWMQEGITTVEEAKASSALYGKDYFSILKFMGISGRNPVENEVALMDTWMKDYGFTLDVIQEACRRTMANISQPSFPYTDKILKDWHSQGVHSIRDIQPLDEDHKKKQAARSATRQTRTPASNNRFNNFPQHEYDYDEIEKRLLNR